MPDKTNSRAPQSNGSTLTFPRVVAVGAILLILSCIISLIRDHHFLAMFQSTVGLRRQITIGLAIGACVAGLCGLISYLSTKLWSFIKEIFGGALPAIPIIIAMSLIAGLSEEIFFRATLQPILGLWFASLLFVLVHFGHGQFGWVRVAYLSFVLAYGLMLGFMYESLGLVSAITAHATFDVTLLVALSWMAGSMQAQNSSKGVLHWR